MGPLGLGVNQNNQKFRNKYSDHLLDWNLEVVHLILAIQKWVLCTNCTSIELADETGQSLASIIAKLNSASKHLRLDIEKWPRKKKKRAESYK